jgi:hypothetical protein
MIKQGSAQTLRYLLYFDEIAGYCPPVREPPSKKLLLLLIKQARAFGLGMILASQNAVDLDYKVISNANVRFIGRLGAQRDIQRVSVGLELDSYAEQEIARLGPGEFYCNVFDPKFKSVIKSRWTLTYHRGPLEDSEISDLMAPLKSVEDERQHSGQQTDQEPIEEEADSFQHASDIDEERKTEKIMPASKDETFLMLEKKFEPATLSSFVRLGSNVMSLKVLSVEQEERYYPVFELAVSVFEKTYSKQSLDKVIELAAFGGKLIELPKKHTIVPHRAISSKLRSEAANWKGELQRSVDLMEIDLARTFDVLLEEKRKEYIINRSARPRAKIADIDKTVASLRKAINSDNDTVKEYEKIYKDLKKESKKKKHFKARLIPAQNKIDTKKQKILTTMRRIEQLHADKKDLQEKLLEIEREEEEKFHLALGNIKSSAGFQITGWLVEVVYRARIVVNGGKEHYGDVVWSSFTGEGTWGRCSACSVPLAEGWTCACGNLMCNAHLAYCKICLEPACVEHRAICHICESTFCAAHHIKCEICRSDACSVHSGTCINCNRHVCGNCSQKKGLIKSKIICNDCSAQAGRG